MSTATVSRTARDLSPATLAAEAARLVQRAESHRLDCGAQRKFLNDARDTVAELREVVARGAFNERQRIAVGHAGLALHEAVVQRSRRVFWLGYARVCLAEFGGPA